MKKFLVVTALVSAALSTSVFAVGVGGESSGHGKVKFHGEIVAAPCSISADTIDQTVEFGQIANSALANGRSSIPKTFNIELVDCVFPKDGEDKVFNDTVKITFTGQSAKFNSKLLGVTGLDASNPSTAGNVGIQLSDNDGGAIDMSKWTSVERQLQEGNNTLTYSARVVGKDVPAEEIPLGEFNGVTNFTLAYN
ncbi:TPA: type 1 fimbrial protein [Morganella morganii]|nr:type 1 fimbrial protein [Morganella morganii]